MITFIDDHRHVYGVEPICRVLPIAPSTYYTHVARRANPGLVPLRAQRDRMLKDEIQRVWEENPGLRRRQGLEAIEARRHCRGALHGRAADEADGPARCGAGQDGPHDSERWVRRRARRIW
ncbi:hypothetical protein QFZ94_006729 [Paraburkholderia sp. JPY465]